MSSQDIDGFELVCRFLEKHTEVRPITRDSRLQADLGISSMMLFAIVCDLEDELGCSVDVSRVGSVYTVDDLAAVARQFVEQ